jgi:Ca2+-binding EF-hand superfamily protein
MSNAIGGIGGGSSMMMQGMGRMQRQDPTKMAEDLFARLDTSGKGYIEKADLQTAFQRVSTPSGASADDVFASLDGDSDGKVTQQEMSDSIKKLSDALESQFQSLRMNGMGGMGGGMGAGMGMHKSGDGMTQEDLTSQLTAIGNTDSNRTSMLSSLIDNFDQVDTDDDGKVSFEETRAYKQSSQQDAVATTDTNSEAQVLMQIMTLAQAYGLGGNAAGSSGFSVIA